jgi:effector-binding domain-containing protein
MNIQTYPPLTVLYSTHQTTLQQLHTFNSVMAELYAEAGRKGTIDGPLYRIYHNMDGRPDALFTLEIAIPVRKAFRSNKFKLKQLDLFKAATFSHQGLWDQLPGSHTQIMEKLTENNIPVTNECREVFLNIDVNEPLKNVTEIQIGVALEKTPKPVTPKRYLIPVYF